MYTEKPYINTGCSSFVVIFLTIYTSGLPYQTNQIIYNPIVSIR